MHMSYAKDTEFDEEELFSQYWKTKDKKIKDKIVNHFIYIAEIMTKRFSNKGIESEDIFQVACLGLVLAVDRFDGSKGVKFASYATPTVTGEIKKYFRDKGCFIRIPRKLYEVFVKAEKLRSGTESENYSEQDIARILNISVETLRRAYSASDVSFIQSLEQEAYSDSNSMYYDTLGTEDEKFLIIENSDFVNSCFSVLNEEEKEFVRLRFYEEKTQKEISVMWNRSQMQISRLERSILEKLKKLCKR